MLRYLWRSQLARARQAARSEQWVKAAAFYRLHLNRRPGDGAAWIQLGHSLKEQGSFIEARIAYQRASRETPTNQDGWIQLAHIERQMGDRAAAISILEEGLTYNLDAKHIIKALLALGERERLPVAVQQKGEAQEGHYALSRYPVYRTKSAATVVMARRAPWPGLLVVIDGRGADPQWVQAIQTMMNGISCLILREDSLSNTATVNETSDGIDALDSSILHLLLVESDARLDPGLIDQLRDAMSHTGALGAYCDHDHWLATANGIAWQNPCFQPMYDPFWFSYAANRPPCVLLSRQSIGTISSWAALFTRSMMLPITYVHIPQVLASRRSGFTPQVSPAVQTCAARQGDIQVIIQTRDAADMIERCVASLIRTAADPKRLDIVVIDNRSVSPDTAALFDRWKDDETARIIRHDEDFNWARANNIGVQLGNAPYLLFLNNDVEVESEHWDLSIQGYLAQEEVGAIGALLLYPDRRIQHAGVIFGMGAGSPVHEGVGKKPGQSGPGMRWTRPRLASAVTGAWLATSRTLFEHVGGFDERLAVAYNDIDFCLRCRAGGHYVVQASDIVAIHRESATRGTILSVADQDRENHEWLRLQATWGEAVEWDPAYNPHWLRTGQPFDGFSAPSSAAMMRWVEQSAQRRPWSL